MPEKAPVPAPPSFQKRFPLQLLTLFVGPIGMRALKTIAVAVFAALALCAGLLVAVAAAVAGGAFLLNRKIRSVLHGKVVPPRPQAGSRTATPLRTPVPPVAHGDVIDISVTEVPGGR